MSPHPIDDALVKIKRANKDIKNADVLIHNYAFAQPYSIEIEHNTAERKKIAKLRMHEPIPDDIDDAVSTALKKIRESLDNLAWAVASRFGPPKYPKNVNFPIGESQTAFESAGSQGKILQNGGGDWAAFLAALKPYAGGNATLYALHRAANQDKHRTLVRVGSVGGPGGKFTASLDATMSFNVAMFMGPLEDGMELVTVTDSQDDPQVHITFSLALREIEGFERQPVITTLRQFSGVCAGIIESARRLF